MEIREIKKIIYYVFLIGISGIIYRIESEIIKNKSVEYKESFEIGYLQYVDVEIRNQSKCVKSNCFCIYHHIDRMLPLCSTYELMNEIQINNPELISKNYESRNHNGFCVDGLCTNKTMALLICQIECRNYYNLSYIVDINGEFYETSLLFEKTKEEIKELRDYIRKNYIYKNTIIITYTDSEGIVYKRIPSKEFNSNIILFSKLLFGYSMIKVGIILFNSSLLDIFFKNIIINKILLIKSN